MLIANIKVALAEEEALEREQRLKEDRERLARKKAQVGSDVGVVMNLLICLFVVICV